MDILDKIVARKKEEVALARRRRPERLLREQATPARRRRPFLERLQQPSARGPNIIAEIKRASPSRGTIRTDLDPAHYARCYQNGGAAALSVLTDTDFFQGCKQDLTRARQASRLPVLRKDFMISSYQLYETAVWGADAALLIVRILSESQLKDYLHLCAELDLDALVEVHDEADLASATRAGANLIGINNRNLRTFETGLDVSLRMAAMLRPHQTGVAESGIGGRTDILELSRSGINSFLIGESLVRAADPMTFLKTLRGE